MKVRFAANARSDLLAIVDWIAADNPGRARSFAAELRAKCEGLSRRPRRFPIAVSVDGVDVRKRVHQRYIIFYTVSEDAVDTVRIVHGARDWGALLVPDP
jgi:toxin ParE1/3/4